LSLDAPAYRSDDSGRSTLADVIPSGESSVEEKIDNQRLQSRINEVLSTLTEREKTIIKMRFGIEDQEDK
jgi:DNA-directed RNA polymerase sigma subunit (sigma70/sigma32)